MKNRLLSTLLILAFSISAYAEEIVYTVSARFGLQTIALDSILIENLTNHSRLLFTNLPNFESYEIDLTSQTIGDVETGINIGNQGLSDFVVVQNQPGLMVLNYHGNRSLDVSVSVVNLNGQVSYISDKQLLNPISTMVIQLGHPGVYLVKVESEGGVQTFKAVGALTGQSFKVSQGNAGRQSLGLKSSGDSDIDDFSFETGDELRLTAYKNGYQASPKTLIVSASQQIEFEFSLINIIRGGPAATNPMAVPIQITGVSADPYRSNLNQWTGSWEAPQAIYDQDIYVNDPDNWSNILSNSDAGTTWSNLNPGIGYGILVVDLEHAREINSVSVFQMFSDGKITHIALAGHPEINSTAPDASDEDWHEFLPKSIVGAGTDGISYGYNPTKYFVEAQTRYVKILAFNDGSYGNSSYIELKGIKMYGGVANSFALNLEVFPEGSGQVSGDGLYSEGTQVEIMATPNEGYTFINWTGDTEYIDDSNVPNSTLMMPAKNIMLTAIFEGNNGEGDATEVVEVLNPVTGRIWMDRNLGASRAATSSNDDEAYGYLYQWGRAADGHQIRTSNTTEVQSNGDNPVHGDFILGSNDWRSPQNINLWQGVNGINNPCPVGYRIPTEAELNAERLSWSSNNTAGAYTSPLKLTVAGGRLANNGSLHAVGSWGDYWSSTLDGTDSRLLNFGSSDAYMTSHYRAVGRSVRCIQDLEAFGHTLNINIHPAGSGIVDIDPEKEKYFEGELVTLTANPSTGYVFSNWTGDIEYINSDDSNAPNAPNCTLIMPAKNITLTAIFEGNNGDGDNGEGDATEVVEVLNPVTGRIWMDRNLGASRAATSSNDTESYGDYYQWGRAADGHQKPNSGETSTRSTSDTPGHGLFITTRMGSSQDWRSPPNHNLWQGVYGNNNPCPIGYRLPTDAELNANRLSWSSNNAAGAFSSPLKLPIAALRPAHTGSLGLVRSFGYYWSSTVDGDVSRCLYFDSSTAEMRNCSRSWANSVRCLKVLF